MKTIWKYSLHLTKLQFIDVPIGARPVHLATQGNCICVWMEVNPEAEKQQREIRCVPTGSEGLPEGKTHLGTVVLPDDTVWHYYW